MPYKYFSLECADKIALLTFDNPPVNAQNLESRIELIEVIDELSGRDDVNVVVLTGRGDVFSAGADIKERQSERSPSEYRRLNRITREAFFALTDCVKPVIAAVNGPAIGAGYA